MGIADSIRDWFAGFGGWAERRTSGSARASREAATAQAKRSPFSDSEAEASGPVDLSRKLETSLQQDARAEILLGELWVRGQQTADRGEQLLLAALERLVRGEGISLPPLPETALRVQKLIDRSDCDLEELSTVIELDPALATRIVGIANSPFYAGMDPVNSVADAVVRMGLRETQNIVFAVMLRSKVLRVPGFESELNELWEHLVAASVATEVTAAEFGIDPEIGSICGLLHDLGRGVVYSVVGSVQRELQEPVRVAPEAISEVMTIVHAPLTSMLASAWRLDPKLAGALAHHHRPEEAPAQFADLARVVAIGDTLARRMFESDPEPGEPVASLEDLLRGTSLDMEDVERLEQEALEAFEDRIKRR